MLLDLNQATGTVVNQGTITATGTGSQVKIDLPGWANAGTLTAANGGTLSIGGTYSNTGTVASEIGSTVTLGGTLADAGGTLTLSGAGTFSLGGTIQGETIEETGGAVLTGTGGTLDGVTVIGGLSTRGLGSSSQPGLTIKDGLVLNGLFQAIPGSDPDVNFVGNQPLNGAAILDISGALLSIESGTLTLAETVTVTTDTDFGGIARITDANASLINNGTIIAGNALAIAGNTFAIVLPAWVNAGTLTAVNGGELLLSGSYTSSASPIIDSNSSLWLGGTLNNAGKTLSLVGTGRFKLYGGTIQGGVITESDGAVLTANDSELDGVTLNGTARVEDFFDHTLRGGLTIKNGLTLNGAISLEKSATLTMSGGQTLGGTGTIVLGDGKMSLASGVLTLASTVIVQTGVSQSGSIVSPTASGSPSGTLVNQGMISSSGAGAAITVNVPGMTNSGTLFASNGGALLGPAWPMLPL